MLASRDEAPKSILANPISGSFSGGEMPKADEPYDNSITVHSEKSCFLKELLESELAPPSR